MKNNNYKSQLCWLFFIALSLMQSCRPLDDVQKNWSDGPEQIYVGKLDSLYVRSGMNRVEIVGQTNFIRTAKTCEVRYADKSVMFAMDDILHADGTVRLNIEDLSAGSYYFYVTTFDEAGNRSIVSEVYGTAYDKNELDYVLPYTVSNIVPRSETGPAAIYWNEMGAAFFHKTYLELDYQNRDGQTEKILVEPDEDGNFPAKTVVDSWLPGGNITVQTYVYKKETDLEPFVLSPEETVFPVDIPWAVPRFGAGSSVDLGSSVDYGLADGYTIELMMRCSEIQDKDGCVIGSTGAGNGMLLRTSRNKLEHYINNSAGEWRCISYEGIEKDRWYHVAVTFEPGNRYTIYLDGELVADGNDCGFLNPADSRLVAGERTDYKVDYMTGDIQHVSVWESARTAEMIKEDMKCNFEASQEGLVAYWPMNLEPLGPLYDITGQYAAVFRNVSWFPVK